MQKDTLICPSCHSNELRFVEKCGMWLKRYQCKKCGQYLKYDTHGSYDPKRVDIKEIMLTQNPFQPYNGKY